MGIKMDHAFDQNGDRWEADTYAKGTGAEPLQCKCGNPPHICLALCSSYRDKLTR